MPRTANQLLDQVPVSYLVLDNFGPSPGITERYAAPVTGQSSGELETGHSPRSMTGPGFMSGFANLKEKRSPIFSGRSLPSLYWQPDCGWVLQERHCLWVDELFSLAIATGHSLEHPAAAAKPALGDFVEPEHAGCRGRVVSLPQAR